jgi:hypothetical protein
MRSLAAAAGHKPAPFYGTDGADALQFQEPASNDHPLER